MAHAYIPSYLGGGDRRVMVWRLPGPKLVKPYLKSKLDVVMHAWNPSYQVAGVWDQLGEKKNKLGAEGVGQVGEHLLNKCKALNWNPNSTRKTKTKNQSGVVVHICNPSYLGGRGRRIWLEATQAKGQDPIRKTH
jgi:hypothetical protein